MQRTVDERDLSLEDGDTGLLGVNSRLDPGSLPAGFVSRAVNMRFTHGVAAPRGGLQKVVLRDSFGTLTWPDAGLDWPDAGLNFAGSGAGEIVPFTAIQGAGEFDDPNGERWLLIAAGGKVYRTKPYALAVQLLVGDDMDSTVRVRFTQCFNVVVMFRSETYSPLAMQSLNAGFQPIDLSATGDGTEAMPPAASGLAMQNRLFIPYARDLVAASDALDYTRYAPQQQEFRINQGSGDALMALVKFGETSFVAFKRSSIYKINNVYGNLADANQEELTRAYGLVATDAVVHVGEDIWFLSDRGIESIGQTEQAKVKGQNVAVSEPISDLIERINWKCAPAACAGSDENRIYFAVPLDDAEVNNTLIVFDLLTGAWAGYDQSEALESGVLAMVKADYEGRERLWLVTADGYLNLIEEGFADDVFDADTAATVQRDIQTELVTRGYRCGSNNPKRFTSLSLALATWNPAFSVGVVGDGEGAAQTVAGGVTTDRTRSRRYGAGRYDAANASDNHGDDYRQDYSVPATETGFYLGNLGISFDRHQAWPKTMTCRVEGRFMQVRLTGSQGRTVLHGVGVSARPMAVLPGART